jgi:rRNA processing protein Krr1/Pno1
MPKHDAHNARVSIRPMTPDERLAEIARIVEAVACALGIPPQDAVSLLNANEAARLYRLAKGEAS